MRNILLASTAATGRTALRYAIEASRNPVIAILRRAAADFHAPL